MLDWIERDVLPGENQRRIQPALFKLIGDRS